MTQTLIILLAIAGVGLLVSGLSPLWMSIGLGTLLTLSSPFVGKWLAKVIDPHPDAFKAYAEKKAQRQFVEDNRDYIGFVYFKTTFLLAGHIAIADGHVSTSEKQVLDARIAGLHLDTSQTQAAIDYFYQGQSPTLDINTIIDEFVRIGQHVPELCEAMLTMQFTLADADNIIVNAEFRAIEQLARRLDLSSQYHNLLEEYRLRAEAHAIDSAQAKVDAQKRERDKRRFEAEKARLNKKLNPKARKLQLSLARLGLRNDASINDIKRAYREQIRRHHPDTLIANGYPMELLQAATKRSADINRAYQYLKTHYHFR